MINKKTFAYLLSFIIRAYVPVNHVYVFVGKFSLGNYLLCYISQIK